MVVQKPTHRTTQKHVEYQRRNKHLEKKTHYFLCFSVFLFFSFLFHNVLNNYFKICYVTVLVRSMTFIWGVKPALSYSKPHTFSALFGEETEILHLLSPTRPLKS